MATVVRSESKGLSKPAVYTFLGLATLPRFRGRARDGPRKTYYVEIRLGRLTKNEYPTKNLKSTSRLLVGCHTQASGYFWPGITTVLGFGRRPMTIEPMIP